MADTSSRPSQDMDMIVTWGDCDAAGISYYARNFDWFTNGRMRFMEAQGLPYMDTFHPLGIALVCLTADCRYKRMLRPEEKITLRTTLASFTRTRMEFHYEIFKRGGERAAEGRTSHTFVDERGLPFNFEKRYPELWRKMTERWGDPAQADRAVAAEGDGHG